MNKSSGKIICSHADVADTFFSRLKGLMFSKRRNLLLFFPKEGIAESSVHMFFMKFSIDLIWINEKMQIVDIQKNIRPFHFLKPSTWKIYKPDKKAKYVLELGIGKIEDIKIGDEVEFLNL